MAKAARKQAGNKAAAPAGRRTPWLLLLSWASVVGLMAGAGLWVVTQPAPPDETPAPPPVLSLTLPAVPVPLPAAPPEAPPMSQLTAGAVTLPPAQVKLE